MDENNNPVPNISRTPEQWQKLVIDNLHQYAMFAMDLERTILSWNPGVEGVLGYGEADFVGKKGDIIFTPEEREDGVPEWEMERAAEEGNSADIRWHLRADGSRFWATGVMTALCNERGELVGYAKVLRDSSEQKEAEEALLESETQFRRSLAELEALYAAAPVGLAFLDHELRFRRVNEQMAAINGFSVAEHLGRRGSELLPELAETLVPLLREVLMRGEPLVELELHGQTPAHPDEIRHWLVSHYPITLKGGETIGVGSVVQDITERKQAEERVRAWSDTLEREVEARTQQLRRLASEVTLAEARERHRVAQVLHDDLQQRLYAVQFALNNLKRGLGKGSDPTAKLEEALALLKGATRAAREVTRELSPPVLGEEGLVETLRWLAAQTEERFRLPVALEVEGIPTSPHEAMRTLLFSLVRELLFNVVKHAQATRATVGLEEREGYLTLRVSDNGTGFDPSSVAPTGTGLGLRSIRERLRLFEGDITIESRTGEGTRVTIVVPTISLTM